MFDKIIERKITEEISAIGNLQKFNIDIIEKSNLSPFSKSFIILEMPEGGNRKELEELIDKSVKLNLNYTIRPKWTILNYIFGAYDSKPIDYIFEKLDIFRFYKFYEESIRTYIEDAGLIVITKSKVSNLIDETNNLLYEKLMTDSSAIKTKNFFLQVFKLKYLESTEVNLDTSIPFGFIRIFLEDKSFSQLLEKFSALKKLTDEKEIDLKTIIKVINGKYISEEDLILSPEKTVETNEDVIDINFVQVQEATESEQPIEEEVIKPPDPIILSLFDSGHINKIQKKIFLGSRENMLNVMYQFDNITKWSDASEVLKKIFKDNDVDIYNKDVVNFVNTINEYYNNNLEK